MKINLQDFQSSMEKKEYLEKKIESKEFLNDDVSMQINTLKYVVELIKNDYKDGKSIKDGRVECLYEADCGSSYSRLLWSNPGSSFKLRRK